MVGKRTELEVPPEGTLLTPLPLLRVKSATLCGRGHLSTANKSINNHKCMQQGCDSGASELVSVQVIGRKMYRLTSGVAAIPRHTVDRQLLASLALTDLHQNSESQRESRSSNPIHKIIMPENVIFPPDIWTEEVFQVHSRYLQSFNTCSISNKSHLMKESPLLLLE